MMIGMGLREAVRSLLTSKQRSLLALQGIIIGISSVIALVSVGEIVKREALRQFQDLGTNLLKIRDLPWFCGPRDRRFTLKAAKAMLQASPELETMAPISSDPDRVRYRAQQFDCAIMGVTPDLLTVSKLKLSAGRFLVPFDEGMDNCVIGALLAETMVKAGIADPLGKKLLIKNHLCTIVGILETIPSGEMRPAEVNNGALLPFPSFALITGKDNVLSVIARIRSGAGPSLAGEQILNYLKQAFPGTAPTIVTAAEIIAQMNRQMNMLTLLLGVVGGISLLVGGIGVMNVMLTSVAERRREIGIRRALGARQIDIMTQFLLESLVLCILGGGIGILAGVGATYEFAKYSGWEFVVSRNAIAIGGGVALAVGLFFGIYPAFQASRLKVIEALRAS